MRHLPDLLIATTNEGKFNEIHEVLVDLPFTFRSLKEIGKHISEPEETESTLEGNAMLKARYYGNATGMLTMADDTGIFVDALDGWPGVKSARVAPTSEERCALLLERLRGVPNGRRGAAFRAVTCVYDPTLGTTHLASGETRGSILSEAVTDRTAASFGYDPLFFVDEARKCYAQMQMHEKNGVSHRGKAMNGIKWILINEYGARHVVAALALIIRDGKILMSLRNDPHRPEYHKTWEFPGGTIDAGETIEQSLVRECREEVGYDVEIVEKICYVGQNEQTTNVGRTVKVFLLPYICKIVGGDGRWGDLEVLETRWFDLDDVVNYPLLGNNKDIYTAILPQLKRHL